MAELGRDDYEDWQTALLVLALIAFGIFGMWLYWRTGDGYKIRQAQKKLGYDVTPIWVRAPGAQGGAGAEAGGCGPEPVTAPSRRPAPRAIHGPARPQSVL